MLDVFEALVLLDRFDTFDGLVDLKLRGMPPGAAMAKDGFAVAADPAIDFPLASNRAWDGVTPSSDLLVGSPGCCLGHGLCHSSIYSAGILVISCGLHSCHIYSPLP